MLNNIDKMHKDLCAVQSLDILSQNSQVYSCVSDDEGMRDVWWGVGGGGRRASVLVARTADKAPLPVVITPLLPLR